MQCRTWSPRAVSLPLSLFPHRRTLCGAARPPVPCPAMPCHAVPFRAASRSVASQDETRDARTQASKLTLETAIFCLCRYYYIFVITSIIPIDGGRQKGVGSADAHLIPSRNRFFFAYYTIRLVVGARKRQSERARGAVSVSVRPRPTRRRRTISLSLPSRFPRQQRISATSGGPSLLGLARAFPHILLPPTPRNAKGREPEPSRSSARKQWRGRSRSSPHWAPPTSTTTSLRPADAASPPTPPPPQPITPTVRTPRAPPPPPLPSLSPIAPPLQFGMHAAPRGGMSGSEGATPPYTYTIYYFTIATIPTRRRPVWDDETN
jgi:hypothetical protein